LPLLAEAPASPPRGPTLVPLSGDPPVELVPPRMLLGRDADCDIVLPYPAVSGKHCELRCEGTTWRIVDLRSKNGVQVNGKPVVEHVLRPGDRVSIARQYHFRVQNVAVASRSYGWYAKLKQGLRGLVEP